MVSVKKECRGEKKKRFWQGRSCWAAHVDQVLDQGFGTATCYFPSRWLWWIHSRNGFVFFKAVWNREKSCAVLKMEREGKGQNKEKTQSGVCWFTSLLRKYNLNWRGQFAFEDFQSGPLQKKPPLPRGFRICHYHESNFEKTVRQNRKIFPPFTCEFSRAINSM